MNKFIRTALIAVMALLFGFQAYAQVVSPENIDDLDREIERISVQIGQRLQQEPGSPKVFIGPFIKQGYEVALSRYLNQTLLSRLANMPNKRYSVLAAAVANSDYVINGEIVDAGERIRIYYYLVKNQDLSVLNAWESNFTRTPYLWELTLLEGESGVLPDPYEPDSKDNAMAAAIGEDAWISRSLHSSNDRDWFLITADTESMLTLEVSGDFDNYLELYDAASGDLIAENDDYGDGYDSTIFYMAKPGDRLIAMVRGYDGETGMYRFRASSYEVNDDAEPNNSMEEATHINFGDQVDGFFFANNDEDWYVFEVTDNILLVAYTESNLDTVMKLYEEDGTFLVENDDSGDGTNARITMEIPEGTYYINLTEYNGDVQGYELYLEARTPIGPDQYEPDNSPSQAKSIEVGVPQTRSFNSGDDVDWVKLNVTRSSTYTISAKGTNGLDIDTIVKLYDMDGNLISEDDDSGDSYDARLSERLMVGFYLIEVSTYDETTPSEPYILRVDAR